MVDFPLSTYLSETDDGSTRFTPTKSSPMKNLIGTGDFILKRKGGLSGSIADQRRKLELIAPIFEEADLEEMISLKASNKEGNLMKRKKEDDAYVSCGALAVER